MEKSLAELFQEWEDLNTQVAQKFGEFNFDSIKEIRKKQRIIEDLVYSVLLESSPADIKKTLPDTCGEMEIGYNSQNNKLYYVTLDPDYEESEETKLVAITIDINKNVELINDFKEEE